LRRHRLGDVLLLKREQRLQPMRLGGIFIEAHLLQPKLFDLLFELRFSARTPRRKK